MTAPELQNLINAHSVPGMMMDGQTYDSIIYPAMCRLEELGVRTQTAVRVALAD